MKLLLKFPKKIPAYDIIKKAIEHKSDNMWMYSSMESNFYIKAVETRKTDTTSLDKEQSKEGTNLNLVEVNGKFYKQEPNKVKEVVDAYTVKGKDDELHFLSNLDVDFNFYNNLIYSSLTEAPLISPLNWTSVMAYKFKLLSTYNYDDKLVYKIAVQPRKSGNALFEGEIDIVDESWAIKRIDFNVNKRSMNYFNEFNIKQHYNLLNDSIWFITKNEYSYKTSSGKTDFFGKTTVIYDSIKFDLVFPKRFFGVEVGVKTEDAYERDSTYWNLKRPEPLTTEEQKHIAYTDSVYGVSNSEWYKDSIEGQTNKITLKNILWFGQDYVNWRKKKSMYFAPVANMFDPVSPGGFRVGYYMVYYKKYDKSKRNFRMVPNFTYGIRNEDLKGSVNGSFLYDPYHIRQVYGAVGRSFNLINPYDAYINMFRRSNFFEQDFLLLGHRMELFNGFYLNTSFEFANRKSIAHYDFVLDSNQIFENNNAVDFEPYKSLATQVGFDYTPQQKYIREPNEKIVLGSKWPTFGVLYTKGFDNVLRSSVDYDKIQFTMNHQNRLGVFGTSKWRVESGKFLTQRNLQPIDYKYQREGDPFLYTNPFTTFQLLPSTFPTFDWYVEWHHLHRFNGAIMNKLPLVRKLALRFVVGDGSLYTLDNNSGQHIEVFTGVERVFRFWRERFRLGVYYAVSQSSMAGFNNGLKFSIEYFDKQSQQWNF